MTWVLDLKLQTWTWACQLITMIILKVNDSCERAVALATDYVRILTKDSTMRRKILQVVEADRKAYTDCSKATYDK